MNKQVDVEFREHFKKLLEERGKTAKDFIGPAVPSHHRIAKTTYFETQKGHRPQNPDTRNKFAALLNCTVEHFLYPPIKSDWERPDIQRYIGSNPLLSIDGAIRLHRAPEREAGKSAWTPGEIELKIDDRVWESQSVDFDAVIELWGKANPEDVQEDGVKYCVTGVPMAQPVESGGKLVLAVQPIRFRTCKPICDYLKVSYAAGLDAFLGETRAAGFRRQHFLKLHDTETLPVPNVLAVHMSVVTSDGMLLLFRRRKKGLGWQAGGWSASFEETLNGDAKLFLKNPNKATVLRQTDRTVEEALRRAVWEELRMKAEDIAHTRFQILGFGMEFETLSMVIYAVARTRLAAVEILNNPKLRNHEEFDCFAYCPCDLSALLPVLLDQKAKPENLSVWGIDSASPLSDWKWHLTSRMRIYLTLGQFWGEEAVEAVVKKSLKSRAFEKSNLYAG